MSAAAHSEAAGRSFATGDLGDEAVRAAWSGFRWTRADADLDFVRTLVAASDHSHEPYAAVVGSESRADAMLLGRIETVPMTARIGYASVLKARLRALTVVLGGIQVRDEQAIAPLLGIVADSLADGAFDVVLIPSVRVGSPLHDAVRALAPATRRAHPPDVAVHRRLRLPEGYDAFLAALGRSTREGVKRYSKKLEREYGDRLSVEVLTGPDDVDRVFTDVEAIAAKTYQRGLGVALADDARTRALVGLGLERGWYRVWLLALDGVPVAFWPGYAYGGVFSIGTPGYDPAFGHLRVGTYLQMRMIEDLCASDDVEVLDFGAGDAEYKRRFSNEESLEEEMAVFAPRFRPMAVNGVRSALAGASHGARSLLRRLGVEDAVRRRLRARAARSAGS
jgi:hypothetical protein